MIRNINDREEKSFLNSAFPNSFVLSMVAIASLVMAACASTPPPNSQITAAETAIAHAEQAQVADYSSPELVEARKNIAAAKAEVAEKNMTTAARLAQKAQLNAELAMAKLSVVKAKTVNDEMQKSTNVIKQELQRNEGVQK